MFKRQVLVALILCSLILGCVNQPVMPAATPHETDEPTPTTAAVETLVPTSTATSLPSPTTTPMPTAAAEIPAKPQLSEFIITFWTPPTITQASLKQIADGGFNLVLIYLITPSYGIKLLDWSLELGLKVMITDPNISPYRLNLEADMQELTDDFKNHPAVWGYYITDEPGAKQFADLARLNGILLKADPLHFPYINLFPNYAVASQLETNSYASYIRTFIETVKPAILSYDHYALLEVGDRPGYFANLEIVRSEALRAGIPYMQIILATPFPGVRDPSAADLRYQVYTTLAYGAKGISYFTYAVPDASFGEGLLDSEGVPTAKWYTARDINWEVRRLGSWLLGLRSTAVYYAPATPELECQTLTGDGVVLKASGGRLQIGEFIDAENHRWIMVVNLDRTRAVTASLLLRAPVSQVEEVDKTTGQLSALACREGTDCRSVADGYHVTIDLEAADGRLFRLD
ncbi:MAG: hypothetical protein ACYCZF_00175 [Anaerolineae bacterium]